MAGRAGTRRIDLAVTSAGFVPREVRVARGEAIHLVVTRKTEKACVKEIVIKEVGVHNELPLGQPVEIHLAPRAAGTLRFACGMDMVTGVLIIQ
ncbi:MAG: cupredoxin domain-containing protein [Deltaproteobacteria bacterium]|nr:cupredoxin domain-containing protein [Deltaproteobacteria bacterium]